MPEVSVTVISPGHVTGRVQYVTRMAHADFGEPTILVMSTVSPSELLRHRDVGLVGIIAKEGSLVSHWSIFARSLGIPAVVAEARDLSDLSDGQEVEIDTYEKVVRW